MTATTRLRSVWWRSVVWLLHPLYLRWYVRTWQAGFDAGVAAERTATLQLHQPQVGRPQWYFVTEHGRQRMELQ